MTEIPDRPFDKIAMDLVTDFTKSSKGNKHILTIIDLLTGWPEAIPIPNKSADTITKAFIRHYLPRHMCPWFILADNGTEFKNQIFDKVTKDLGIKRIFSAPYHPTLWKRWKSTTTPTTPTTHQILRRSRFRITMPRPTSTIIVHS